jgi:hypothetical protein
MVTSVTKGRTPKLLKGFYNFKTYYDHTLESSRGALSDGTISFPIEPFPGGKFIKKTPHP